MNTSARALMIGSFLVTSSYRANTALDAGDPTTALRRVIASLMFVGLVMLVSMFLSFFFQRKP
jgi:hypothetical protein